MTTTTDATRSQVVLGTVPDGYRVSGHNRTFKSWHAAFNAAWRTCLRTGADLYATDPNGALVPLMKNEDIQNCDAAIRKGTE